MGAMDTILGYLRERNADKAAEAPAEAPVVGADVEPLDVTEAADELGIPTAIDIITKERYKNYIKLEGALSFEDWVKAGKPRSPEEEGR